MSILIKGMEMPTSCGFCLFENHTDDGYECRINGCLTEYQNRPPDCPLVTVPPHGRLIDADALRTAMYHEAFETGTPMQRWDSGCWIRYKMFERAEESAPTIIPAEEGET